MPTPTSLRLPEKSAENEAFGEQNLKIHILHNLVDVPL